MTASRRVNDNGDSIVFAVDVSETLKADFALLRETPFYAEAFERRQKFSRKTVDTFARYITCRNYASLCFELSHLCWAIINTGSDKSVFEYFYVAEAVTAKSMQNYFSALGDSACQLNHASVSTQHNDRNSGLGQASQFAIVIRIHQHSFTINSGRANVLGVCMEWLVTILPNVFERMFTELSGKGFNAIGNLALSLQKDIYNYLSEHLPAAKAQSKFQHMRIWLEQQGKRQYHDDDTVLLWQTLRKREGVERYTTVVKDVFQYQEALDKATHVKAMTFSEDTDNLPLSEQVFAALEICSAQEISIDILYESPKLISKQQAERLQLLSEYPTQCMRFGLTVLRYSVFGPFQAKCIQAQRNKTFSQQSVGLPDDNLYARVVQKLSAQISLNEMTFYAVLHILLQHAPEQALSLLTANHHALNEFAASAADVRGKMLAENSAEAKDVTKIMAQHGPLLDTCKRAYQQNNRQGFTPQTLLENIHIYADRTLVLLQISDILRVFIEKNRGLFYEEPALSEKYQADGCIFSNELLERMLP